MSEQLTYLIEKYSKLLAAVEGSIDELNEVRGDDFNPMDASGGNFDDAYRIGAYHGELYKEFVLYNDIIADLKTLKEDE